MKNKIALMMAIMILAALIPSAFAFGPTFPCPVALKILTTPESAADNLVVELSNSYGFVAQKLTSEGGYVTIEGDSTCGTYTARILDCMNEPACTKSVSFNPDGYTTWDISKIYVDSICPVQEVCVYTPVKCVVKGDAPVNIQTDECDVTVSAPSIPADDYDTWIKVLAGLVAGAGGTGLFYAFRIKKSRDGTVSTVHTHYGIKSEHSVSTLHMNVDIRHPRGCWDPVYENSKFSKCLSGKHKF